jgi:hypothetical protein
VSEVHRNDSRLSCYGVGHKSAKQRVRETGISRSSAQCIRKRAKWEVYIRRLLCAMTEDDLDRRVKFVECFQHKTHEDGFVSKTVWSSEATFQLSVIVNRHNCTLGSRDVTHSFGQGGQFTRTVCVDCNTGF